MKFHALVLFLFFASAYAEPDYRYFEGILKKIELRSLKLTELCSGKPVDINTLKFKRVKIWAINCGSCLSQIRTIPTNDELILINIDQTKTEKKRSCLWTETKSIRFISLHDTNNIIMQKAENKLPLPVSLEVENFKIVKVHFN